MMLLPAGVKVPAFHSAVASERLCGRRVKLSGINVLALSNRTGAGLLGAPLRRLGSRAVIS